MYIIIFEATYYKLLLLYYNIVVSALVADWCIALAINTEVAIILLYLQLHIFNINSTLHATNILHVQTKYSPFSHSWSNNIIIMPGILYARNIMPKVSFLLDAFTHVCACGV